MPTRTAAIPSPKATTRTTPYAARPAATVATRISRALVEGTNPPDSPSAKRLRQDSDDESSVAGAWLCTRQPWRWRLGSAVGVEPEGEVDAWAAPNAAALPTARCSCP